MRKPTHKLKKAARGVANFISTHPVELLPFRKGWSGYRGQDSRFDFKAGLTVALLALPQGMAFASVAGVDVVYGIGCATVAALAAFFFCSSPHIALGPTNATAFTVFSFFATYPSLGSRQAELMPVLAVLVALVLLAASLFHVAELMQYISRSVMVGYITGAAVLIMSNQMADVLGVSLRAPDGSRPRTFVTTLWRLGECLPQTNLAALAVAVLALGILLVVLRWRRGWPALAMAMAAGSLAAWGLGFAHPAFRSLAFLQGYDWHDLQPQLPHWSPRVIEDAGAMFGLVVALAFIASLETTVMVKGLASRSGEKVNLDQDLFGVGMANAAASMFGGVPASSSLTRSALAFAAGGRSRVAMLVNGLFCGVVALGLGPLVAHVPRAVLAALVVAVAWRLFNRRQIRTCLTATRSDASTMVTTLLATLFVPLYVAIFVGAALSILLYLHKASRPDFVEYEFNEQGSLAEARQRRIPAISIVHVEGDLFFGAADIFRTQVQRTMLDPMLRVIILRLRNARNLDATSVMALEDLVQTVRETGRFLIVSGITKDVYRVLRNSGMLDLIGRENIFVYSFGNPNLSTRFALLRAQELLGTKEADIQIYIDQNKKRAEKR